MKNEASSKSTHSVKNLIRNSPVNVEGNLHQGDIIINSSQSEEESASSSKKKQRNPKKIGVIIVVISLLFFGIDHFYYRIPRIIHENLIWTKNNLVKIGEGTNLVLGKYEITEAEYASFIIETKYKPPTYWNKRKPSYFFKSKMPIVEVSWQDATAYCGWLQQKLKVQEVRLPTEIEWERAAKGDDSTYIYPWGLDFPNKNKVHFGANQPIPVNQLNFLRSKFGLFHMGGNVAEWCSPSPSDRKPICEKGEKIVKGGAFNGEPEEMVCIARRCLPENIRAKEIGFRIVVIE